MARCLQIRVSAFTYDEGDVRKAWPVLWRWAFEETTPAFPYEMQGVLELVRALDDLYQFGDLPDTFRKVLEQFYPTIANGVEDLKRQLANWNPQAANHAVDVIEDGLTDLEKHVPKP